MRVHLGLFAEKITAHLRTAGRARLQSPCLLYTVGRRRIRTNAGRITNSATNPETLAKWLSCFSSFRSMSCSLLQYIYLLNIFHNYPAAHWYSRDHRTDMQRVRRGRTAARAAELCSPGAKRDGGALASTRVVDAISYITPCYYVLHVHRPVH